LVSDPDRRIAGADVHLCGDKVSLSKHGQEFVGKARVSCEGTGSVLLHLKDGRLVPCEVGYVTPGAIQAFRFRLQGTECRSDGAMGFM